MSERRQSGAMLEVEGTAGRLPNATSHADENISSKMPGWRLYTDLDTITGLGGCHYGKIRCTLREGSTALCWIFIHPLRLFVEQKIPHSTQDITRSREFCSCFMGLHAKNGSYERWLVRPRIELGV